MLSLIMVVALLHAKPGQENAVERAIVACVAPSRAEDGNISYIASCDQKDPALFIVVEQWANKEAREKHLQS